jgi:hypothetical protein
MESTIEALVIRRLNSSDYDKGGGARPMWHPCWLHPCWHEYGGAGWLTRAEEVTGHDAMQTAVSGAAGFLQLLSQLTTVGDISRQEFEGRCWF